MERIILPITFKRFHHSSHDVRQTFTGNYYYFNLMYQFEKKKKRNRITDVTPLLIIFS
jgi:CRISPR/Cas system-associated protein Csx1